MFGSSDRSPPWLRWIWNHQPEDLNILKVQCLADLDFGKSAGIQSCIVYSQKYTQTVKFWRWFYHTFLLNLTCFRFHIGLVSVHLTISNAFFQIPKHIETQPIPSADSWLRKRKNKQKKQFWSLVARPRAVSSATKTRCLGDSVLRGRGFARSGQLVIKYMIFGINYHIYIYIHIMYCFANIDIYIYYIIIYVYHISLLSKRLNQSFAPTIKI